MEQDLPGLRGGAQHRVLPLRQVEVAAVDQKLHILPQLLLVHPVHDAVGGELVQPQLQHPLVFAAAQHRNNLGQPQPGRVLLLHPHHAGEDLLRLHRDVLANPLADTVSAVAAALRRLLAEVAQQVGAQAAAGLAVAHHLLQPAQVLLVDKLALLLIERLILRGVFDKIFCRLHIPNREQQQAVCRRTVPARAARLLVVAFDILGHVVVHHKADVGLVDSHPEGVGGDHHPGAVELKVLLVAPALLVVQPRVIAGGGKSLLPQFVADRLDRLAGGAVDDAGLLPVLGEKGEQRRLLLFRVHHLKVEVGAVKAGGQPQRVDQPQHLVDVVLDLLGGGGGEGPQHRPFGQLGDKVRDSKVAGAEVLPPLGDAVRLVHRYKGDLHPADKGQKVLGAKPLRRDVQQLVRPLLSPAVDLVVLGKAQRGIDAGRGNLGLFQRRHLVLHQRDQRRNHQRQPRQHHGRQLVADRLARAGGHHPQHIPAGKDGVDQLLLSRTKLGVAKILF